jgi:predicted HAD superfamily Cof-like phosphohydrolase
MYNDVVEFHNKILNQRQPESPSLVSQEFIIERMRFLQEELDEFSEAGFHGDMTGAADGLADIIYVALGTMYLMNLPVNEIWDAVQSANMRKVRGATKRGNAFDAAKPLGWEGPEKAIAAAILRHIDDCQA